jgi:oxidoreductase AflX
MDSFLDFMGDFCTGFHVLILHVSESGLAQGTMAAAATFAVLGATGKTGRGVVQGLLANTDINIHIYVRSRSKLSNLFPGILSDPRVTIFEGPVRDPELMTQCLAGVSIVIFTLGDNENRPGLDVIEAGAKSVLSALQSLKDSARSREWQNPRIIMLSSSTWNPRFAAARPALVHWMIKTAFSHPYADLVRGQTLFIDSKSLCDILLVQPGGLVQDAASGHEISTESVRLTATYADLAAAFVELATVPAYAELSAVGVSSRGGDNYVRYGPLLGYWIVKGLFAQFVPGFWTVHDTLGSVTSWALGK